MSFWSDLGDSITDTVKDLGNSIGGFFSDPLGALEDAFNASLDFVTGGLFSYTKDALRGFVAGLIPEQTFQDRERTVRSATEPRQVIYGKVRTGGQLVYVEDDGKDNVILWMCYVVAGHSVNKISAVYADGTLIATGDGSDGAMTQVVNDVTGNNHFCWAVHGKRFSAFIPVNNSDYSDNSYDYNDSPPNWTSSHRLTYQSYVWITLAFDKETFGDGGLPKFTFDVEGKDDIYDPRTGTTGYTDNHGLALLDILLWDRMFGEPLTNIEMQDFIDAANIADELVASGSGTTEKRYTVNGTFKLQAVPLEILQSIAAAGSAFPYFDISSGKWKVTPGAYSAPVMSLNESDLVGGLSFQAGPSKNNRHNTAKGTYIDAAQDYEAVGFRELYISQYVSDDLEELEKSYDFAWTNSGTMARRLAKIDIERNRFGISCKAVFKFRALRLAPGDRIELTIDRLGWSPKIFRVEAVEISFESGVALDLREDAPEIYEWEEGDALALDPPPALSIPGGVTATAPASMTFSEELYRTLVRNAVKVRLTASWPDVPSAIAYDVQYYGPGESTYRDAATYWQDNDLTLPDVQDGQHFFRVRSINGIGIKSVWAYFSYTVVGKSEPPPNVTTLVVEKGKLRWEYTNAPVDLAGFLVRFQNGNRQLWADATPMHKNIVTETVFDISQYSGQKTFLVKAVDTTGNESAAPAILVQSLGDAIVENVIATQSEAPAWDGELTNIINSGATLNLDFAGEVYEQEGIAYSGFVNAQDELEVAEIGDFYADSGAPFYSPDPAILFYSAEYSRLEYLFDYTVIAADEGSNLTVDVQLNGAFNERLDYKPPGYTGDWLAFPGSVEAIEGQYQFRFVIPSQQLNTAPKVSDIVVSLDVDDVVERFNDVVIASGGTRLSLTKSFRDILNVSLTLQADGGTASTVKYLDKDEVNGPLIQCYDSGGTAVAGTIDAIVQGF
jgi:hypothetical protein